VDVRLERRGGRIRARSPTYRSLKKGRADEGDLKPCGRYFAPAAGCSVKGLLGRAVIGPLKRLCRSAANVRNALRCRRVPSCLMLALTLAVLAYSPAAASASSLFVSVTAGDDQGGANNCQTQATPCKTIAQAVAEAAQSGDVIHVAAGTYPEAISTAKDLTFVGAGSSMTTIDSTGTSAPALALSGGGTVEDLAVTTDDSGIGGALQASGGDVVARDITATGDGSTAGTDAIDVTGGSFELSDSTAGATNTDADVTESWSSGHLVVFDGSGVEVSGGTATINQSTVTAVEGIALRVHDNAQTTTVSDSLVESSGVEDIASATTGSEADGWQSIEAGAGTISFVGDTVYNATLGSNGDGQPPADALTTEPVAGVAVSISDSIMLAQAGGSGVDVDAIQQPVTIDHSSFSTTSVSSGGTITSSGAAGNIFGAPQLSDPADGNFALGAGSRLIGSGAAADVQGGEVDLDGSPRSTTCSGGLQLVDIGAVESPVPMCPAAAPQPSPGSTSYLYVERGTLGQQSDAYEQFSINGSGLLGQLDPFEISAMDQHGKLISGAAASDVYALENGALQQYQIATGGQLVAGALISAPSGGSVVGAALSADGKDLYVSVSDPAGTVIDHEQVAGNGALSADGSLTLQPGFTGAQLHLDNAGRLYALTSDTVGGGETLIDYRVNPDGSLTQEDSLAISGSGSLVVATDGREAVLVGPAESTGGSGLLYPVAIDAQGQLTAESSVASGDTAAGHSNYNNPTGAQFSSDGATLFVTDEDQAGEGDGLETLGSMVAPFTVNGDGSLTEQTPTPDPNANPSGFPNSAAYDAGLALNPDGIQLYVPDNANDPTSGQADELNIGSADSLAGLSTATADTYQDSVVLVTPPGTAAVTPAPPGAVSVAGAAPPAGGTTPTTQSISGTATEVVTGQAVADASVSACPPDTVHNVACVTTSTNSGGRYSVQVGIGTWLVLISPPGNLFDSRVTISVTPGAQLTQNFALAPPVGLSDGLGVDGVTHGVLTFLNTSPFTITAPLPISQTGTPNTTQLFTGFAGLETGNASGGAGFVTAMILFAARYGADGQLAAFAPPAYAVVNCTISVEQSQACQRISQLGAGGVTSASFTRRHSSIAHEVPEPQHFSWDVTGEKVQPNSSGGVQVTETYSDGTSDTVNTYPLQIPTVSGNYPGTNALINAGNAVINKSAPVGAWNTFVGTTNALAAAGQGNAGANGSNAAWQVAAAAVGTQFHGGASVFWNLTSGDVSNIITDNGASVTNTTGAGGTGSVYIDPSGIVKTRSGIPIYDATVTLRRSNTRAGAQRNVPSGSTEMSPGNRSNPYHTNVLGEYGWDVLPGFYSIAASKSGCKSLHGRKVATTAVLPVPPAQTGVNLELSCRHLARGATHLRVTVGKASKSPGATRLILATVTGAGKKRPQGTVIFRAGHALLGTVFVTVSTGRAEFQLPVAQRVRATITATYSGDGLHDPATARGHI
jgi:hypothetical protein